MTCRSCVIAQYLEEENRLGWYGDDEAIRVLAHEWHDRCAGDCDCEVEPCERRILSYLRAFHHAVRRFLHVPRMPR